MSPSAAVRCGSILLTIFGSKHPSKKKITIRRNRNENHDKAIAAENYRKVTPAYYEISLKTKYVRDDISGQIIDLIHDSSITDFAYVNNNSLGKVGHTMRSLMSAKNRNFTSVWKANERVVRKYLETLVAAYGVE